MADKRGETAHGSGPKETVFGQGRILLKFRPSYPDALLRWLESESTFSRASIVADIGSGTGILSEMLLRNGNIAFGVEPNEDMRKTAERNLSAYANFRSINGSAESTGLSDESVDFVMAAQSFHWFEPIRAKAEFRRILRQTGWVVLIWNRRKTLTPFLRAYDQLVKGENIVERRVRHEDLTKETLRAFLGNYREVRLPNFQSLNYEGLVGRLLSASYTPLPGDPQHERVLSRLRSIFDRFQSDGYVTFEYETEVYAGQPL